MKVPAIEIQNLKVIYNKNTTHEVVALKDFSLRMEHGEALVITGANGSGKSTLLRAIAGLVPIESGEIWINGKNITGWSAVKRARIMGFVHQDTLLGTCPNLTLHENFQLTQARRWWSIRPYSWRMSKAHITSLKATGLPLEYRGNTRVSMLSGGQRQALALCLAFEGNKSIVLLDEFTSALDHVAVKESVRYVSFTSKQKNTTMIMVSHRINDINDHFRNILSL